jgi:hypothetical protein
VFEVLALEDRDLHGLPMIERKKILPRVIPHRSPEELVGPSRFTQGDL